MVSCQLMEHHYVTLKFSTEEPVYFEIGDSVELESFGYFELTSPYFPTQNTETGGYDYELQLDAYYYKWKNKLCKYRPTLSASETSFTLTSTIDKHLQVILDNLSALGYTYNGKAFSVDYTTYNKDVFDTSKAFYITYDSVSIYDALTAICDELDCEWWVDGNIIYFGYCEMVGQTTFRLDDNMLSMSQSESKSTFATRLYAFGSDRNIPKGYFTGQDADVTVNGVASEYLMLPDKTDTDGFVAKGGYIENTNIVKSEEQAVEGVVMFEDEYPKVSCSITDVKTYDSTVENEDGTKTTQTFYQIADTSSSFATSFKEDWIKEGLTLMLKFESGSMNGMEFECAFKVIDKVNYFEVVANDSYGRTLPDASLHPKVGDNFILYNWDASKITDTDLISQAQTALYERAKNYYIKAMIDPSNFTCVMDGNKFWNNGTINYHPLGEQVKLIHPMFADVDTDGNHYRNSRIIGFDIKLDIPYDEPEYIVGEKASYSRLGQLEDKINSITVNGGSLSGVGAGGSGVYVIGLNDTTPASDSNVLSARRALQSFLRKDIDDVAAGTITLQKGARFGTDANISIDAEGKAKLTEYRTTTFESGLYGKGALIDNKGAAELKSLFIREFLSVPKLIYNQIAVTAAEQWNTNAYGTIESVDTETQQITLHLEENDYGSVQEGDICRGIYADLDNVYSSDSITEGSTDDCNFVRHRGFFTTYFYVVKIITSERGKCVFQYGKKSSTTPDPCAYMDFAQYGSFTDESRQSSMYMSSRGNSFIEVLDGVNTWQIQAANRVCRIGWLGNLTIEKKDGTTQELEGNGLFVQDNIYFGNTFNQIADLFDLDELRKLAGSYEVSLSRYEAVITVDDMGNVIGGLWTQTDDGSMKQWQIGTAVFASRGTDILMEEDDSNEDVTEGHYRVYAVGDDCEVYVRNSTIYVTAIDNIKDGVSGSEDDADFDYDAMRKMSNARVSVVVDLEGKTSKTIDFNIRIQHDSLPFMVCDLDNEMSSVIWNTKTNKYVGFPFQSVATLSYHNEPWLISSAKVVSGLPSGVTCDVAINTDQSSIDYGKATFTFSSSLAVDTIPQRSDIYVTITGKYAGATYEYTKTITLVRSADTVIYELIPTSDSVIADKNGTLSSSNIGCNVWATSSDDKRYQINSLPSGMSLKYGVDTETASSSLSLGSTVSVTKDNKYVVFALFDANGNTLDRESVPILAYGVDGKGIEYVFKLTATDSAPSISYDSTSSDYQKDDYVPSGWTDDPTGVNEQYPYEWVCVRRSINGVWQKFGDVSQYSHYGSNAPYVGVSDDIVTIPTDTDGKTLEAFSETINCVLFVDGDACTLSSVSLGSSVSGVSVNSNKQVVVSYASDALLDKEGYSVNLTIKGTHGGKTYTAYKTIKIIPNVTGEDGDGYEYVYYLSTSSSAPSAPSRSSGTLTSGWVDDVPSMTTSKPYIYVAWRKGEIGADGTFSTPKLFAQMPKSIKSADVVFILNQSSTTAPTNGISSWETDINKLSMNNNWYVWAATLVTYTDGSQELTGKYCLGSCDNFASIVEVYAQSNSSSIAPADSSFSTSAPTTSKGYYLWTAQKLTYNTSNTTVYLNKICSGYIGTDGRGISSTTTKYYTYSSNSDGTPTSVSAKMIWDHGDTTMPSDFNDSYPWLWSMTRTYYTDGSYEDSEAHCIGYKAKNGEAGKNAEYSSYSYGVCSSATSYSGVNSWLGDATDVTVGTGQYLWMQIKHYTSSGTNDFTSYVRLTGEKGEQGEQGNPGDDGTSVSSVTSYYLISASSSGVTTNTSGWSTSMVNPTQSKPYLWSYLKTTYSNDKTSSSTPVIIGNFAEQGPMGTNGCIVRTSVWKSGAEYRNDSALTTDGVKYLDYVYVENSSANDGWDKYVCKLTHTYSSSFNSPTGSYSSTYWTKLSESGPIYSPLIVAKNAAISFSQGQQFNLVSDNAIFGSFRIPGSDGYALWLGGTSGTAASFKVTSGGKLYATDAEITGNITATTGQIGILTIGSNKLYVGETVANFGSTLYQTEIGRRGMMITYTRYGYGDFAVGDYAVSYYDSSDDYHLQSILGANNSTEETGLRQNIALIRKRPTGVPYGDLNNYKGAALMVDVKDFMGICSLGGNLFGSVASSVMTTTTSITSSNAQMQNNRCGVLICNNTSNITVYMPQNPIIGQMLIVIQNNARVTFNTSSTYKLRGHKNDSGTTSWNSDTTNQWNFFVFSGSYWQFNYECH